MLIVVQEYQLVMLSDQDNATAELNLTTNSPAKGSLGSVTKNYANIQSQQVLLNSQNSRFQKIQKLEVALQIDDLQVISFDRFV